MTDRYLELLGDADLEAIAVASHVASPEGAAPFFRANPYRISEALAHPDAFDTIVGPGTAATVRVDTSPLLVVAVAVHRAAADLSRSSWVVERIGGRIFVPFTAPVDLASFIGEAANRQFIVELLGSYSRPTHLASAAPMRHPAFNEFDVAALTGMLARVNGAERAGIFRRLGDLALFTSGVFADQARDRQMTIDELALILDTLPARFGGDATRHDLVAMFGRASLLDVFIELGPIWYRMAARAGAIPQLARPLITIADRFDDARHLLTHLIERYLPNRYEALFPVPPS